jgi:hypothetical protein
VISNLDKGCNMPKVGLGLRPEEVRKLEKSLKFVVFLKSIIPEDSRRFSKAW